jgi:hypothetical protein
MVRKFVIAAASAAAIGLALAPPAFAQKTGGTADEAKAMLTKAIDAVRADEAKALNMFDEDEGEFRDRDLYVFCATVSDGTVVAMGNPNLKPALGIDIRTAHNPSGRAFGAEIYTAIQKPVGQITELSYLSPTPDGDDRLLPKVTFVARANNDVGCGVGYYK